MNRMYVCMWASQQAQWVKNPPAMQEMQEMQVRFLGQEGGHSNSLEYSCMENPMSRGAWQAYIVHGVAKS